MTFTEVFGGTTIYPSGVSYRAIPLSADQTLSWPAETATNANIVAQIMDVTPSLAALSIIMPPADEASVGETTLFFNAGSFAFTVKDNGGNTIVSIPPGLSYQVYLIGNATPNGTWRSTQYAAGTSSATAGSLVGAGIKAINTTLNQSMGVTTLNANYAIGDADRSEAFLWAGGAGTLTLPSALAVGNDWFCHIRNSGTGAISLAPTASQLINGATSLAFNPGDSAIVICDGSGFFTIGFGQSASFAFDYVSIDLTSQASPYTLSGANLNRIAYSFGGTLTADMVVYIPATFQQYWLSNATVGGFSITVKVAGQTGVIIGNGVRAICYCNGTDLVDADTSSFSFPVSIAQGGTGATNESGARINLGGTSTGIALFTAASASIARSSLSAAASGANSDITSLTGLTTAISVAQGGTGATTVGAARTALGATTVGGNVFTLTNPNAITFPRFNADNTVSALDAATFRAAIGAGTSSATGTVTSVGMTVPAFLSVTPASITSSGTFAVTLSGTALPIVNGGTGSTATAYCNLTSNVTGTLPIANGGTGATTAALARTALGATTLGSNIFTITNPSAVTFPRFNADNTISALDAATFRTAIGAGTSSTTGTVTTVGFTGGIVSIANPTTTPAFTVAGTSGGIPYFSSSSTWASSGILSANAIVIGGGAGVAPTTTTTGTGVVTALGINVGSAGAFVTFNGALGTPSSGTLTNCTFPTLNQNTTGTAANVTGTVAVANGGTGQVTYTDGQLLIGNSTGNTLAKTTLTAGTNITITNGPGSITISAAGGGGGGTVTSVSFTGGIVSVATPTTTPAFTVAGTSGGIPYFSSGSTWATSAALAANAIVVGGGAGLSPATVTTGTGVITALGVNTGSAGAFVVNGGALGTPLSGTLTNCTFPTLNQNTTGTAANVTGTVAIANGGTGATTAAAARTNFGATTLGSNLFTLPNPGAINFPRFNADNTVSSLDAAAFRTAIGAGTVTSVAGAGSVNGITLTGTVTASGSLTLGGTLSGVSLTTQVSGTLPVANGGTGATTLTSGYLTKGNGASAVSASVVYDDGTNVGIGTPSPTVKLQVISDGPPAASGNMTTGMMVASSIGSFALNTGANSTGGYTWLNSAYTNNSGIASPMVFMTGATERFRILTTGGITSSDLADAVGYKGLPQNSQTAAYTLALSDMGKHISITTGGVVIPANGAVAFPIGSAISIFNNSGSNQTISITTDTLRQAGTANTGSRTLAQYGVATCLKVTSTVWVISGAGIS